METAANCAATPLCGDALETFAALVLAEGYKSVFIKVLPQAQNHTRQLTECVAYVSRESANKSSGLMLNTEIVELEIQHHPDEDVTPLCVDCGAGGVVDGTDVCSQCLHDYESTP